MKKIVYFLLILFFSCFLLLNVAKAQEQNKINIYFFWQQGCPHCAKEKPFLENLAKNNSQVELYDFDISSDKEGLNLLINIGKKLNIDIQGVPFTLIGEKYFIGWYSEETTGSAIEKELKQSLVGVCRDVVEEINNPNNISGLTSTNNNILNQDECRQEENNDNSFQKIDLPLFGEIEVKNFSLPILTIIFGALDGFNPCAMWVLLFLITLLLGMQDRKRMWILGSVFIVASSAVYFIFMSAWLDLLLFLGFVFWIRIIIGIVALGCSWHNLKEYFINKAGVCQVTGGEKKQKIFAKLKQITTQKSFGIALVGIILLAFAVNLVELICSAGLPAVYTQILTLTGLSKFQYYLYIFLYILIFMLDDLIVFVIAMITLKVTGITSKYTKWSYLIGGILMLIIGLLLIFKPEILMFG
ncbi:MAG TPA: thioredoxin family protein [bacterium]|nr:thioredoxin family protein [bacterium]